MSTSVKQALATLGLLVFGERLGAVGAAGALLLLALFDWVLILLSSVEGAHLISSGISLPEKGTLILFVALAVIGVIVQGSMLRRSRSAASQDLAYSPTPRAQASMSASWPASKPSRPAHPPFRPARGTTCA